MRSEDKKDKIARDEISADDLLRMLHKSVENNPKKPVEAASKPSSKPASDAKTLEIDEKVYDNARDELLTGNGSSDETEVDIEALIDKYINRTRTIKAENAASEAKETAVSDSDTEAVESIDNSNAFSNGESVSQSAPAVKASSKTSSKSDEGVASLEAMLALDSEIESMDNGIVTDDDVEPASAVSEFANEASEITESTEYSEYSDDSEYIDDSDDSDMKLALIPAESEEAVSDAVESADKAEMTAIFDNRKIKEELEKSPSEEMESVVDEAFRDAATEVFTPVHPNGAADASTATKTYGEPDTDEIDQTDLNLMIAFGMNEELKDTVGSQKADAMEADNEKKSEETMQFQQFGSHYEYTDRAQNNEILIKYQSDYYWNIIRIAFAFCVFGVMFLIENLGLFGIELPAFMHPNSYPVVYAMLDLQFVVFAAALVAEQFVTGIKNMIALKPTVESLTAFSIILSVLYTVVSCVLAPKQGFVLHNLPVALTVILALIYEFMRLKRDVFSFNVISTKRKKFVISPVSDSTESLEREMFNEYLPEDSKVIRVGKTDFVDGFFAKVSAGGEAKPIIGVLMPAILVISVAFFFLSYIRTPSFYSALTLAFQTATVTMPITAFMIHGYPLYRAAKNAYDRDSTIIGEKAYSDYAGQAVISFEDKEVFPTSGTKVTSIKVYGNNRIDEIIYNVASAFITVGGPLADVFSQATHDMGHSENVILESVDEDGFTVIIDDISVNIGKASYMEKQDFEPPYDPEDKRIEAASVGIMYIAYQGELAAKIYVQYTIDNEFEKILTQLYKTGMCIGIKSFDPNIDDMLLAKKIKAMKYPVRVIRSTKVEDIPHTTDRCDSSIVSKRSVKELLRTVASCEKVSSAIKVGMIFKILGLILGIVVMVFVLLFGQNFGMFSIYTTVYQLIWLVPVLLISRFAV